MKKRLAVLLSMVLTVSVLAVGCGDTKEDAGNTGDQGQASVETEAAGSDTAAATEGSLKTGLGIITSISSSADAADADGAAQADVTIAAVTVDADGKIVECAIDIAQTVINFSADGKITTDLATEYQTKQELGEEYGMKSASSIGKEWNEQADAFAAYCVGKTADEVTGIAVTEAGTAADEDLAASCTVHIGGLQAVVAKAVGNATEAGAQAGDKLGIGAVTSIANSTDASADAAGVAQAYTTVSVVTVNADGVITSAAIDAVQANVNFDATGKITSDLTAEVASKDELGDAYGMKSASSIGKEWNEQAAAYAAYAVGKTADEVNATAVTEGVPSDADLAASVTVHVTDFNTVITKAVDNAK